MTEQPIQPDRSSLLLVVDCQPDFMPGGALGVAEGDRIVAPVSELMRSGIFPRIVATQDWHPRGHISFASSHPGISTAERKTTTVAGTTMTAYTSHRISVAMFSERCDT